MAKALISIPAAHSTATWLTSCRVPWGGLGGKAPRGTRTPLEACAGCFCAVRLIWEGTLPRSLASGRRSATRTCTHTHTHMRTHTLYHEQMSLARAVWYQHVEGPESPAVKQSAQHFSNWFYHKGLFKKLKHLAHWETIWNRDQCTFCYGPMGSWSIQSVIATQLCHYIEKVQLCFDKASFMDT